MKYMETKHCFQLKVGATLHFTVNEQNNQEKKIGTASINFVTTPYKVLLKLIHMHFHISTGLLPT